MKTILRRKTKTVGNTKGISSIIVVVIAAVVVIAGAGLLYASGYFGSTTNSPISQGIYNYHGTTSSSSTASIRTSSISSATSSKASGSMVQVDIVSGAHLFSQAQHFVPETITVKIGVNNTVEWINQDSATHTVTSNNGAFDSGDLAGGSSFSFTFMTPGTYEYHCSIHTFMTGEVIVLA